MGGRLTGVEVTGVEVTGVEVTGVEVAGVEVTGVEVAGVEVTGVEVTGVEVTGVEVTGLSGVRFVGLGPGRAHCVAGSRPRGCALGLRIDVARQIAQGRVEASAQGACLVGGIGQPRYGGAGGGAKGSSRAGIGEQGGSVLVDRCCSVLDGPRFGRVGGRRLGASLVGSCDFACGRCLGGRGFGGRCFGGRLCPIRVRVGRGRIAREVIEGAVQVVAHGAGVGGGPSEAWDLVVVRVCRLRCQQAGHRVVLFLLGGGRESLRRRGGHLRLRGLPVGRRFRGRGGRRIHQSRRLRSTLRQDRQRRGLRAARCLGRLRRMDRGYRLRRAGLRRRREGHARAGPADHALYEGSHPCVGGTSAHLRRQRRQQGRPHGLQRLGAPGLHPLDARAEPLQRRLHRRQPRRPGRDGVFTRGDQLLKAALGEIGARHRLVERGGAQLQGVPGRNERRLALRQNPLPPPQQQRPARCLVDGHPRSPLVVPGPQRRPRRLGTAFARPGPRSGETVAG